MNEASNSAAQFSVLGEMRLSRYIGLNLTGSFGGKTQSFSNGNLVSTTDSFSLGVPIYFSSADRSAWSPFVMPGLQAQYSDFSLQSSNSNSVISDASKWQFGPAATVGVQFRLSSGESGGLSVRPQVGVFQPLINSQGVTSKPSVQGGVYLNLELFKK